MGRSYKEKSLPIGSGENIVYPVIDVEKLTEENPNYITGIRIGEAEANSFSYSSFDRYTTTSKLTNKITSGFNVNLGVFSAGVKQSMTNVFTSTLTTDNKSVFGELNVEVIDSHYTLQTSSYIIKKIILNYLSPIFKEDLYNTTPSEVFANYGGFVLTSFFTGGRATALFIGEYKGSESSTEREENMTIDINASYGINVEKDPSGKISADFGIGKNYLENQATSNKIESLQTSVKTIGGNAAFSGFTIPKRVDDINIDLSQWVGSLNDKTTHSIIDIADGGLLPLEYLVLEENFNYRLDRFYYTGIDQIETMQEPYIEILDRRIGNYYFLITSLVTRYGDRVTLEAQLHENIPEINNAINRIKNEKANIYGLKIVYRYNDSYTDSIVPDYTFEYYIKENSLKKFVDTKHNMTYLLYVRENSKARGIYTRGKSYLNELLLNKSIRSTEVEGENGKFGLSIYNDRLLDTYAFRRFIDSLPSIQIDPETLFDYHIIAL